MDRIIEIDEKNRFAIIEPYVIGAQLQAEVMKLGLNLNIIGAGCSTSIVASACAYSGIGPAAYNMGGNAESLLGQEWVTPDGEIIRTGSLSSGCGWFSSRRPRAEPARHHPWDPGLPRRPRDLTPSAPSSSATGPDLRPGR